MSLRSFLTRERPFHRTLFAAFGVFFIGYSAWQFFRGNWGVACFLGGMGLLSVLASALLSEERLSTLATAFLLFNVLTAVTSLLFGVRVQ